MGDELSYQDRKTLMLIARQALQEAFKDLPTSPLDYNRLPPILMEDGATFVTITINGELRGCVGTLEAYQPLAEDVREHTLAAAFKDYRFPPLQPEELPDVEIEISRLTKPKPLAYQNPQDLLKLLRPGIDGVLLQDGIRRATFLPQVWEKLPNPVMFLSHLCQKMGVDSNLGKVKNLTVSTYQVEMFHESELK
jgi:AmmeMemoRadiSam system protein A